MEDRQCQLVLCLMVQQHHVQTGMMSTKRTEFVPVNACIVYRLPAIPNREEGTYHKPRDGQDCLSRRPKAHIGSSHAESFLHTSHAGQNFPPKVLLKCGYPIRQCRHPALRLRFRCFSLWIRVPLTKPAQSSILIHFSSQWTGSDQLEAGHFKNVTPRRREDNHLSQLGFPSIIISIFMITSPSSYH